MTTMKRLALVALGIALAAFTAGAQSSASGQAGASAQGQTSAGVGKTGAQAQTGAAAQSQTNASASKNGAQGSAGAQGSGASSASAQAGGSSLNLANGSTVDAQLVGSLDARKNKPGDPVVAKTTQNMKSDGKVVMRKGTKLMGHVSEANARGKGESQSTLGIVFDKAVMKNGQEVPVNFAIQALASGQTAAAIAGDDMGMGGMASGGSSGMGSGGGAVRGGGGGLVGGVGSTVSGATGAAGGAGGAVGSTVNTATSATGGVSGRNATGGVTGALGSNTTGVIGIPGLALNSVTSGAASAAAQGSVISSSTRNVHLDNGTRMVLRSESQAQGERQKQ